jgi:hypothetical protein
MTDTLTRSFPGLENAQGVYGLYDDAKALKADCEAGTVQHESGLGYYALWIDPYGTIIATEGHMYLCQAIHERNERDCTCSDETLTDWGCECRASRARYEDAFDHGFVRIALGRRGIDVQAEHKATREQTLSIRRLCYAFERYSGWVDAPESGRRCETIQEIVDTLLGLYAPRPTIDDDRD